MTKSELLVELYEREKITFPAILRIICYRKLRKALRFSIKNIRKN